MRTLEKYRDYYFRLVQLIVLAAAIGAITALFEVVFAEGLIWCIAFFKANASWMSLLMPFFGFLLIWLFKTYGGISKKGMSLVFEVSQGLVPAIPKRTLFLVSIGTWLSHLGGASVGREGVAVQIGAAVSNFIGNHLPDWKEQKTIFLVIGMGAGFAGLFGTPFSAAFFALEVLSAGRLELEALLPIISACLVSAKVSSFFGIVPETYELAYIFDGELFPLALDLLVLGVVFGLCGGLFAFCLKRMHQSAVHLLKNPYLRIAIGSLVFMAVGYLFNFRYSNTGALLFDAAFLDGTIYPWDFALKFLMTILCLSCGFIGGEVTPMFAIGASLGALLGPFFGLPSSFCAALGFCAVFGAGTNTWLSAIMIGMELFGYQYFPLFFCVCSAAYMFNGNQSIYTLQQSLDIMLKTGRTSRKNHSDSRPLVKPESEETETDRAETRENL